jgi:UTP--glucose-1-phosphate uridylyltransferase
MKAYAGKKITKAVIPAAGYGTRFLPLTKTMPKEMLPVVHKPVIHYVVEEAYQSGITDILIITGKEKRAIEDYFDVSGPNISNKYLDDLDKILNSANIFYVRQRGIRGLGDAIRYAESFCGDEPFSVHLGDTITQPPCMHELIEAFYRLRHSVVAVEEVPEDSTKNYGIVKPSAMPLKGPDFAIEDLVEKPAPENAPSNLAILGSYVFTPAIFGCIRETTPDKNGEIQLTDAMKILNQREGLYAHSYQGRRYDIGNKLDWLKSNIELGLKDPEFGNDISEFIRRIL